jgi:hypothetical protein
MTAAPVARQIHLTGEGADGGAIDPTHQRHDFRHRNARPVDDDFLPAFHPLDDAREMRLGVMHVVERPADVTAA